MMMTNLLHGRSSQGGNLLTNGRWAGEGDNAHLVIIMNMIMMIMIMMIMKIIFPTIMIMMIMILMIMMIMIKRTICWTCGWVTIASPTVFPKPNIMFTTPVDALWYFLHWCVLFVYKHVIWYVLPELNTILAQYWWCYRRKWLYWEHIWLSPIVWFSYMKNCPANNGHINMGFIKKPFQHEMAILWMFTCLRVSQPPALLNTTSKQWHWIWIWWIND